MFCPSCGKRLQDDAAVNFCFNCGINLLTVNQAVHRSAEETRQSTSTTSVIILHSTFIHWSLSEVRQQ